MLVTTVLLVMTMTAPVPGAKPEKLSPEQLAAARAAIYDGEFSIEFLDGRDVIDVPEAVAAAYRKNAGEAKSLLLKIAEGGHPGDSVKALCYLIELQDGPGTGIITFLGYKYETWDQIDKHWKATPRDYCVALLKEEKK